MYSLLFSLAGWDGTISHYQNELLYRLGDLWLRIVVPVDSLQYCRMLAARLFRFRYLSDLAPLPSFIKMAKSVKGMEMSATVMNTPSIADGSKEA